MTIAKLYGRTYLFVLLERMGEVVVYDLSDPRAPRFVDYVSTRNFLAAQERRRPATLGQKPPVSFAPNQARPACLC